MAKHFAATNGPFSDPDNSVEDFVAKSQKAPTLAHAEKTMLKAGDTTGAVGANLLSTGGNGAPFFSPTSNKVSKTKKK